MTAAAHRSNVVLYGHRLQDPSATGISRYTRQLIAALARRPDSSLAYTMAGSGERRGPEGLPAELPYRHPPGPRRLLHTAWSATSHPTVDRFVGHPDLVHVLYPSTPVPSRAPIIYTIHDLIPLRHPEWFARYERWAFTRAVTDAAGRAAAVIAVSVAVADQVKGWLGIASERVHVVHLGVAPDLFIPPTPEEVASVCSRHGVQPGGYLLVLGAVSTRKNLTPVINALAATRSPSTVPLLAVGPPAIGATDVIDLIARRGLGERVRLTGWLPSSDVRSLLGGARALLHPSLDEGFGMTPLEAMACGVPTAVSDASLPEVVGDSAILVGNDPQSWAVAIDGLIGDEQLRSRLIERGRRRAADFTWDRTAEATTTVYRSVLT
ncbi:MAG: glycosyltransferase family 4 protein [Actinomycetota bacterium]|nr:glycosyltransferase family 4 protein [Actinomycetota bacterium]